MPISADILNRRATHFVLWTPRPQNQPPRLVLGRLQPGNPPTVEGIQHIALALAADAADLFEVAAASCGLDDGVVYHYWFELDDSRSTLHPPARVVVTDPFAAGSRAGKRSSLGRQRYTPMPTSKHEMLSDEPARRQNGPPPRGPCATTRKAGRYRSGGDRLPASGGSGT